MARVKWVGAAHRRVITRADASRHGLSLEESVQLRQGEVTEVPDEFADWLLSDASQESRDWRRVAEDGTEEAADEVTYSDPDRGSASQAGDQLDPASLTSGQGKAKSKAR